MKTRPKLWKVKNINEFPKGLFPDIVTAQT